MADLDPTEKLLFLYLLTNERSTLAGVYELPLKTMAVESGIETEMVRKILSRFEEDGKVKYQEGWVAIKNFLKHHEHGSPTVRKGIDEAVKSAPDWAKEFIGKGIDTLSPSASALSSASILPAEPETEIIETSEEEDGGRSKSTAKYPNAREVFRLFGKYPKVWERNSPFCAAAQWLYEEKGMEELSELMDWYQKRKLDQFCPRFHDPMGLVEKYPKLEEHLARTS